MEETTDTVEAARLRVLLTDLQRSLDDARGMMLEQFAAHRKDMKKKAPSGLRKQCVEEFNRASWLLMCVDMELRYANDALRDGKLQEADEKVTAGRKWINLGFVRAGIAIGLRQAAFPGPQPGSNRAQFRARALLNPSASLKELADGLVIDDKEAREELNRVRSELPHFRLSVEG